MNVKTTGSLLVIALCLFAFIALFERPARKAAALAPDTRLFPGFSRDAVTALVVRPAGKMEIRAERAGPTWQLVKPLCYPAHAGRIQSLLHVLENIEWRGRISAEELRHRPNAQEEFGLSIPQVSLVVEQGGERIHVIVGSRTAFDDEVFLQVVGGAGIYLADARLLEYVPQEADQWRDTALVRLEGSPVNTIRVRSGENRFELQKEATSRVWRMTKPLETRADSPRISDMFAALRSLEIIGFASDDPNPDWERFGLRNPELELVFASGTNQIAALHIGKSPDEDASVVYARRPDENTVLLVNKFELDSWRASHGEFRDRRLVRLPPEGPDLIEVGGPSPFNVRRQPGGWIIEPQKIDADAALVEDWLDVLAGVEVDFEKSVVTDFTQYGLEPPALQYTVRRSHAGEKSGRVSRVLARIDFGTVESDKAFLRHTDEASVKSIHADLFDRLPREPWQLRHRRVWNFDSTDVIGVTVRQQGRVRRLIRNERLEWAFAAGHQGMVNTFALEETLHRLGELHAIFWRARGQTDSERFGFDKTDHRVELEVKRADKTETLVLEFGKASEFHHPYAATLIDGQRTVFEFPWELYFELVRDHLTIPPANPLSGS